jgi:hypothetical protein
VSGKGARGRKRGDDPTKGGGGTVEPVSLTQIRASVGPRGEGGGADPPSAAARRRGSAGAEGEAGTSPGRGKRVAVAEQSAEEVCHGRARPRSRVSEVSAVGGRGGKGGGATPPRGLPVRGETPMPAGAGGGRGGRRPRQEGSVLVRKGEGGGRE